VIDEKYKGIVVVVDDNKDIGDLHAYLIRRNFPGYEVITAYSGEEALRAIAEKGLADRGLGEEKYLEPMKVRIKEKNRKRNFYYIAFPSPFLKDSPRNLIVMYDIPHLQKKERGADKGPNSTSP
jgi:CheY-like chemotaxis protein